MARGARPEDEVSAVMMFRAIIVGAPGSGKGTISSMIVNTFGLKHISSGDLLRLNAYQSPTVKLAMKEGRLIPDEAIESIVFPELIKHTNWLLDGFPRTLSQAQSLMKHHPVDMMINLNVSDETIVERLRGRWIHISSGRIYHTEFNPPEVEGMDDISGEPLQQRDDDHPTVVQQRLNVYHKEINPVLEFFQYLKLLRTYTGTESKALWPAIRKDIEKFLKK